MKLRLIWLDRESKPNTSSTISCVLKPLFPTSQFQRFSIMLFFAGMRGEYF